MTLPVLFLFISLYTRQYIDKKENKIVLIYMYKDIQMESGAKSYMRKGFLIYEEMHKYALIYEDILFTFLSVYKKSFLTSRNTESSGFMYDV
jgi:hypothetical protein